MITVRYFANIRELFGIESETVEDAGEIITVAELINYLIALHGQQWADTLHDKSVLVAVNKRMAKLTTRLDDNDEVAFFPPVTGG